MTDFFLNMNEKQAVKTALLFVFLSFMAKGLIACLDIGFYSGDDVEVFEMVFARLFDWKFYQAWGLRNPLYPFVFIYPVQKILVLLGVDSPQTLVFGGRMVVAAFSCLNLWLVFEVARREFHDQAAGVAALIFLALNVHYTAFSASILPRTVASTFILSGLLLLVRQDSGWKSVVGAAVLLAVSAAIRYSEIIFFAPAALFILLRFGLRPTLLFSIIAAVSFLLITGAADYLYWGKWFNSLKAIVDFTLIHKQSTRGFQGPFYYLEHVRHWTDWITMLLALASLRWNTWKIFLWLLIPIVLLSALPHKEPRYLVPMMPLAAILAGYALVQVLAELKERGRDTMAARALGPLPLVVFIGVLALGLANYRFPRADSPILAARWIRAQAPRGGLVAEQMWRLGGLIYLADSPLRRDWGPGSPESRQRFSDLASNPKIIWAAIQQRSLTELNLMEILKQNHFIEVDYGGDPSERPHYRLFKKSRPPGPRKETD